MSMLLRLALASVLRNGLEKGKDLKMNSEIGGIVRTLVSALGGYLVAKGVVDSETATTVGGALATIIVAVWSVWSKRKA
jgi:imidazole glycerol phosphate synthase subunit HisF